MLLNVALLAVILAAIPMMLHHRQPFEQNARGVDALNAKHYDEAISYLRSATERSPGNADFKHNLLAAYNSKAINLAENGETTQSLDFYEKALTLSPDDQALLKNYISTLNNLAVDFSNKRRFVPAQKYFERASQPMGRLHDPATRDEIRRNYSALLTLWGSELMKHNQVATARTSLQQALDLDTRNAVAHVTLGDLAYENNDYKLATEQYSAALPLDAQNKDYLQNRIQMMQEESKLEPFFKQLKDPKGRFYLQYVAYSGGTTVGQVLDILNDAYDTLGKDLKIYPARAVNVKIYQPADFMQVVKLPEWAIGIFDGKLRLRVDEVESAPAQVRDLLFHEYTHAVLAMNVKQKVPAWFHEGMAQLMEPQFRETASEQEHMREALARNQVSFEQLKNSFKDIQNKKDAENAYLLSKYFLAYLNRKYGHEKLTEWVQLLTKDVKFEQAFKDVYGVSLDDAQKEWIDVQVKKAT